MPPGASGARNAAVAGSTPVWSTIHGSACRWGRSGLAVRMRRVRLPSDPPFGSEGRGPIEHDSLDVDGSSPSAPIYGGMTPGLSPGPHHLQGCVLGTGRSLKLATKVRFLPPLPFRRWAKVLWIAGLGTGTVGPHRRSSGLHPESLQVDWVPAQQMRVRPPLDEPFDAEPIGSGAGCNPASSGFDSHRRLHRDVGQW